MNKTELVTAVSEKLAGAEPDARQYIDAVFDTIMHQVATGDRVQIIGFGTFDSVERAARVGHNPRSGAQIQVAASVAPRFQAGQTFRAQVKETLAPSAGTAAAEAPAATVAEVVAAAVTEKAADTKPAKTKAAKKSVAEKAVTAKPSAKKAGAEKAVAEKAGAEKAVAEKPAAKKPEKPTKTAAKPKDAKAATKKTAKAGKSGRK